MGFFYDDDEAPAKQPKYSDDLVRRSADYFRKLGCRACPLDKVLMRSPKMEPVGHDNPDLYIIGECPTAGDDKAGEPFSGHAGDMIEALLPPKIKKRWNNAIRCRPKDDANVTANQLLCCGTKQFDDIDTTRPKVILALGSAALQLFTGLTNLYVARGRPFAVQVKGIPYWLVPTLDAGDLIKLQHMKDDKRKSDQQTKLFENDVALAVELLDEKMPKIFYPQDVMKGVELLYTVPEIVKALRYFTNDVDASTIDLETNGIRPYKSDSKILTVAISDGQRHVAFPFHHKGAKFSASDISFIKAALLKYITSGKTIVAHHATFEWEWLLKEFGPLSAYKANVEDTMVQAYLLDERIGGHSLNFLMILNYGLNLKAISNVDANNLANISLDIVLNYNVLDAKYTHLLWKKQMRMLDDEGLLDVYYFQVKRIIPLVIAQLRGVLPDQVEARKQYTENKKLLKEQEELIENDPDVKKYKKKGQDLKPTSNPSLGKFLADFMGFDQCKKETGSYTVGEEVLHDIDHPVAQAVLKIRGINKIVSTYIAPYFGEGAKYVWDDGRVHTNFNHTSVATGRLSSDDPNLQNWPKRKGVNVRKVVKADEECLILSNDYGQVEARVFAMASKDPVFCKYIWEDHDIHLEWAEKIAYRHPRLVGGKAGLKDKIVMKTLRSDVKNQWTFPLLYGSSLASAERNFNLDSGDLTELYDEFWETFQGLHEWQKTVLRYYDTHGYVECLTGRRRHAPLSKNQILNSPIQGTASDIVVDAMTRISIMAVEREDLFLAPVLNVHDDLTFVVPENKVEDYVEVIAEQMCLVPFDFVNVPLTIESSVGPNWGEMEDIGVFKSTEFIKSKKR